jgi:hypothetical protein
MIRKYLSAPRFQNEDDNLRSRFVNGFGLAFLALIAVSMVPQLLNRTPDFTIFVLVGLAIVVLLSLYLLRRGYLRPSAIILIVLTWLGLTFQAFTAEGVRDVIVIAYIAVGLLASIIISWRTGSVVVLISIGAIWALALLETNGLIIPSPQPLIGYARDLSIVFIAIAILTYFSTASLRDAVRRANASEQALVASNRSLQDLNQNLEERVAGRTIELESANRRNERRARQFEAIARVARATASNQQLQTLLASLTGVISEQFGFYHTGIFLLDQNHEFAVLTAANSEGGRKMLNRGHRLRIGQTGLVGVVSATGAARIALDVGMLLILTTPICRTPVRNSPFPSALRTR